MPGEWEEKHTLLGTSTCWKNRRTGWREVSKYHRVSLDMKSRLRVNNYSSINSLVYIIYIILYLKKYLIQYDIIQKYPTDLMKLPGAPKIYQFQTLGFPPDTLTAQLAHVMSTASGQCGFNWFSSFLCGCLRLGLWPTKGGGISNRGYVM